MDEPAAFKSSALVGSGTTSSPLPSSSLWSEARRSNDGTKSKQGGWDPGGNAIMARLTPNADVCGWQLKPYVNLERSHQVQVLFHQIGVSVLWLRSHHLSTAVRQCYTNICPTCCWLLLKQVKHKTIPPKFFELFATWKFTSWHNK